jgi:integrase
MPKQRLTDKSIRGLKAPANGNVDYWDELLPGLALRVGHGGTKSFFVGTRVKGRYRRITLKPPFPHLELADARSQAREIIADAQGGIGPEVRKKRSEKGTFGVVADAFMQDYVRKKNLRTAGEYQRKINTDLLEWHDRHITDITRGDIKELLREKARGAPTSANRLKSLISKIFAWALKEEIIEASPAMKLDPPGGDENERERNLTADEIKIAWSAFDKIGYPWGPLWKMLLVTGQRRGEVAGMKWSEIAAGGWRLPGERAKKGKGHLVPLSTLAREILNDVPEIGKHVFTIRKDQPPKGWSRATRRLYALTPTIGDWHPHDLRRTFATQLRTLGIDRLVVSKLLNHAEAGVTKVYDRYSADPEKIAAMELWANRLRDIINGTKSKKVIPYDRSRRRSKV